MLGPTQVGQTPTNEHGLGLMTYNKDWLDFHGLRKLLRWLQLDLAGGFYLTDVRCRGREKDKWTTAVKTDLGPDAKVIKPMTRNGKVEDRARVGGSIIIVNNDWGTRAYDWFQNESELGLVMGV